MWDLNAGARIYTLVWPVFWLCLFFYISTFLDNSIFEGVRESLRPQRLSQGANWLSAGIIIRTAHLSKKFLKVQKFPAHSWDSSVRFSHLVMSNSLRSHEPLHSRPLCPSPAPRIYPNSCPLSRWCHPTISSSVVPFSSRPQSFPASGSFQMSQFFILGGQSIGVSASASVLPVNT